MKIIEKFKTFDELIFMRSNTYGVAYMDFNNKYSIIVFELDGIYNIDTFKESYMGKKYQVKYSISFVDKETIKSYMETIQQL